MRSYRKRRSKTRKHKRKRGGSTKYSPSMFYIHPPVAYGNKSDLKQEPYFQSK